MVLIESVYKKSDWSVDGKGEEFHLWNLTQKCQVKLFKKTVKIRNVPIYPHQEKSGRGS